MKKNLNLFLLVALAIGFFCSLQAGSVSLNPLKVFTDFSSKDFAIFFHLRLPRTLLALLAGGTLGLCGAAMQGYLKNPLAEPGTLGITGGATLGAVIVLYFGISSQWIFALPLGGLTGAFIAALFIFALAPSLTHVSLILAGIAFNALALALTSLLLNLAPNPFSVLEIVFWQMGSVAHRSWQDIFLILPFILIGLLMLCSTARALEVLSLGDDTAQSLGVNRKRLSIVLLLGTALSVGAVVSVCGGIGFVGLVVPHLLRPFVDHQPKKLLFSSFLGGALLLILADILVRVLPFGSELKLGVVTSFIGAPFFIFLLLKTKRFSL
jgi:iron complex transport system permease protein